MTAMMPGWQLPFTSELQEGLGELRAALLTTFEPPDAEVLVEDVLPVWLGLAREATDSGPEQTTFIVELQQRIKALRGRLSVFTSTRPSEGSAHWLWNDVRLCTVGAMRPAVQHAKVWLLHRGPGTDGNVNETLEIVISSMNLTRSALRGQIQACWRAIVPLERASAARLKTWGVLPGFLSALGEQTGRNGQDAIGYWSTKILSRATCPDVQFVASVPGRHRPASLARDDSAWGAAGIRKLRPVKATRRIDIVVPTVGTFTKENLALWAKAAGTTPARIRVAWIGNDPAHPWATNSGWRMAKKTGVMLRKSRVEIVAFPIPDDRDRQIAEFHESWDETADRWLHAKLYWIRDAKRCRMLLTSANWSHAAWGRPAGKNRDVQIDNFELGVVFNCGWKPLEQLEPLNGTLHALCPDELLREPAIAWGRGCLGWEGPLRDNASVRREYSTRRQGDANVRGH